MNTEFNELLSLPSDEKGQIWIIGSREWVTHKINEFYVRRLVSDRLRYGAARSGDADRVHFTPIIPAPFAKGKFMTVLEQ